MLDSVPMAATLSTVLAHLFAAYLVFGQPFVGRGRFRGLKEQLEAGGEGARLRFYRLVLVAQLGLVLTVAGIWLLGSIPALSFGLTAPDSPAMNVALAAFLVTLVASTVVLRHTGDRRLKRALQLAGPLLPMTTAERWWFALVSLGAGFSEELACRGFMIFYLGTYLPWLGLRGAVVVSSLAFGLGHLYQGVRGVLVTAMAGLFLATVYVISGTLLVPMVAHAAIDLRLLAIFTPERLRKLTAAGA